MSDETTKQIAAKYGNRAVCATCRHAIVILNSQHTEEYVSCTLQNKRTVSDSTCSYWGKAQEVMVTVLPIPPGGGKP